MSAVKYLKSLILDRNNMSTKGKWSHYSSMIGRLGALSMVNCKLSDESGVYLALSLQYLSSMGRNSHHIGCRSLILSHNNLSDQSAKAFSENLSKINITI
jgi:hypothetical protein